MVFLLMSFLVMITLRSQSQAEPQDSSVKVPEGETDTSEIIFQVVEEQAQFPGGIDSLYRYLAENLKYPEDAKPYSGTVYVEFIIEKDGRVTNVKARHSITHPSLDKAAIEAVMGMPKWKPGRQRGLAVRTIHILPVQFNLPEND